MIATAHRTTHFRPRIIRGHAELPPQGRQAYHGLGMATATRQMRDRVERIMKEGLACDCCSETPYLKCITQLFGKQVMVSENGILKINFVNPDKFCIFAENLKINLLIN